jgi:hypothetical protein
MPVHYGYEGEPISTEQWLEMFERSEERTIAVSPITLGRDGVRMWVSTVWIGIDYNFLRVVESTIGALGEIAEGIDTRPWPYETMVFDTARPWWSVRALPTHSERWCQRTATRAEALDAHLDALAWIKGTA